jgi:hypothetical protein
MSAVVDKTAAAMVHLVSTPRFLCRVTVLADFFHVAKLTCAPNKLPLSDFSDDIIIDKNTS